MRAPKLDTAEIADRVGVPADHIRKLAREGRIPHYRIGGRFKFDPREVDAWLADRHVTATPA